MKIRHLLFLLVAIFIFPMLGLFAFIYVGLNDIETSAQAQRNLVMQQSELVAKKNQKLSTQSKLFSQQMGLLKKVDSIRKTTADIERLKKMFADLQNIAFSAAISRRVNLLDQYKAEYQVFYEQITASTSVPDVARSELLSQAEKFSTDMDSVSAGIGKRNKRPAVKLFIEGVRPTAERINDIFSDMLAENASAYREQRAALNRDLEALNDARAEIVLSMETMLSSAESLDISASEVVNRTETLTNWLLTSSLVILAFCFIGGWWIGYQIIQPIVASEKSVTNIADNCDFSQEIKPQQGEVGHLLNSFQNLLARVSKVFQAAHRGTEHFDSAAEEIQKTVAALNTMTSEQSEITNHLVESLRQSGENVKTTEEFLDEMRGNAKECIDATEKGLRSVRVSDEAFSEIAQKIQVFAESASSLKDEIHAAANILQQIGEIAESTNLLALNAAIESARAGEHGRGFAVVAEEVRALSLRSERSSKEIRIKLMGLTDSVDEMHLFVEACVGTANEGSKSVHAAVELIETIGDAVDKMTGKVDQVHHMANENEQMVRVANDDIARINEQTAYTKEVSARVAHAFDEVVSDIADLNENLRQFKL